MGMMKTAMIWSLHPNNAKRTMYKHKSTFLRLSKYPTKPLKNQHKYHCPQVQLKNQKRKKQNQALFKNPKRRRMALAYRKILSKLILNTKAQTLFDVREAKA